MTTELADHGEGGLWLTITELASREGVGKPTISEKVKALEADGLIKTKPGRGRQKLVNLAQYLTAIGKAGDAAKELAAETRAAEVPLDAPTQPGYRDAQTRRTQFEADLKELELRQRQGELVAAADLGAAAQTCMEAIVAVLDRLKVRAPDMAAAVGHDGERGARAQYARDTRDLRSAIAEAFNRLLAGFPAAQAAALDAAPAATGPFWGDLDPAIRD